MQVSRLAALALPVLLPGGARLRPCRPLADADPRGLAGTYLAARTADVEKDVPNAADFYRSALESDPGNVFLLERALVLQRSRRRDRRTRSISPSELLEQPPTAIRRGSSSRSSASAAKEYAEPCEKLNETGAGVLAELTDALLAAWASFGEGEVDKALQDLDKLKGEDWYEPFKLLHGGYIALAAGRTDEALTLFEKARELDDNAVRITEAYARALAIAGREDEAEAALEGFSRALP